MQPKLYVTNYPAGDFRAMPALGGGHALLKWVTSFPGNPRQGPADRDRARAALRTPRRGSWRRSWTRRAVTALRTAAAAVIAAETLVPRRARSRSPVIGCGVNGAETARMFRALGSDVARLGRRPRRARHAVADRLGATGGAVAARRRSRATSSSPSRPARRSCSPPARCATGQHVSLMGADGPGKAEVAVGELAARRPLLRRLGAGEPRRRARRRRRGGRRHARARDRARPRARRRGRRPTQRGGHHAVRLDRARDPGSRDRQGGSAEGRSARPRAARALGQRTR